MNYSRDRIGHDHRTEGMESRYVKQFCLSSSLGQLASQQAFPRPPTNEARVNLL